VIFQLHNILKCFLFKCKTHSFKNLIRFFISLFLISLDLTGEDFGEVNVLTNGNISSLSDRRYNF
jgi:hypothetical protein